MTETDPRRHDTAPADGRRQSAGHRVAIAVVARPGESKHIAALVRGLARKVHITAWRPGHASPDALLATSHEALTHGPKRWRGPTCVLLPIKTGGSELLVGGPADSDSNGRDGRSRVVRIPIPETMTELPDWDPMPAVIRQRWRQRLGWPSFVMVPPGHGDTHIPIRAHGISGEDDTPGKVALVDLPEAPAARVTALGLANAAVLDAQHLPSAIALATPVVSYDPVNNPALAELVPVEADIASAIEAARELADSTETARRSAELMIYRRSHRIDAIADAVLVGLGLQQPPRTPGEFARARLDEIGLPADSPLAGRVQDAFGAFDHPPTQQGAHP